MAVIGLKFDEQISKTPIVLPIEALPLSKTGDEAISRHNITNLDQTRIVGVLHPLIIINNTYVPMEQIIEMSLYHSNNVPALKLSVLNNGDQFTTIDPTGVDNEIRLQILPTAEGMYKKIDLTFKIISMNSEGQIIHYSGEYKLPTLHHCSMEAYGRVSSYDLFEYIAKVNNLGFASNVDLTEDVRYIYKNDISHLELMNREIKRSGGLGYYDYWIDFWNILNFVEVESLYYGDTPNDEVMVWVSENPNDIMGEDDGSVPSRPIMVPLILSNNSNISSEELRIMSHRFLISNSNPSTDRAYFVYNAQDDDWDGLMDIDYNTENENDVIISREYLGEVYGNYNYLLAEKTRNFFFDNIAKNDNLEVTLKWPMFGVIRGSMVPVILAYSDTNKDYKIEAVSQAKGVDPGVIDTLGVNSAQDEKISIDPGTLGYYYVTDITIIYTKKLGWEYKVKLSRPKTNKIM